MGGVGARLINKSASRFAQRSGYNKSSCAAFHLPAGNRPDVWNFPANLRECFYRRNDPENDHDNLNDCDDDSPKKIQNAGDNRDPPENETNNGCRDIEKEPGTAKNDRLHGVKTDKAVALFQDIKDNAAN